MDSQTVSRGADRTGRPHCSHAQTQRPRRSGHPLSFVLVGSGPAHCIAGAVPISIATGNGSGTPAAYVPAGAVILLFSVGLVAMGRHVVDAGAFYTYIAPDSAAPRRRRQRQRRPVRLLASSRPRCTGSTAPPVAALVADHYPSTCPGGSTTLGDHGRGAGTGKPWASRWAAKVPAVFVLSPSSDPARLRPGHPHGRGPRLGAADSFLPSAALQGAPWRRGDVRQPMSGFEANTSTARELRNLRRPCPRDLPLGRRHRILSPSPPGCRSRPTEPPRSTPRGGRRPGLRRLFFSGFVCPDRRPVRRLGQRRPADPARHLPVRRHPHLPQLRQPLPVRPRSATGQLPARLCRLARHCRGRPAASRP